MNQSIREFNAKVQNLLALHSDENESLLNRSLSLVATNENISSVSANSVENCQFYINLYKIINTLSKDSDVLWSSLTILHQASKNLDTRNAIINKFKFFPLLAKLLQKLHAPEKIERVLNLMQDLSYGIQITWEEPYLSDLIKTLIREIYADDNELAYIALSVLINISYKNFPVICLLMKSINSTSFSEKIKPFGILANKMLIIMEINNISTTSVADLHLFIKKSFLEIEKAIQNWNVPLLQHIVCFLTDSKDYIQIHEALKEYENFQTDIEVLIQAVNLRLEMDDSNKSEEHVKNLQTCFSLIFELLNYIIAINKNNINLMTLSGVSFEFFFQWVESKYACEQAIILLETVVRIVDDDILLKISKEFNKGNVEKLLEIAENNKSTNKFIAALQKLLIILLQRKITEKIILSTVTESYFDKIFSQLLCVKPNMIYSTKLNVDDISKYLYCFALLIEFSCISKSAWIEKVNNLMNQKQIQFILAKAILIENETLCNVVFQILKNEHFPQKEVAKIITQLSKNVIPHSVLNDSTENSVQISKQLDSAHYSITVSKDCEERLNALIEKIYKSNQSSEFDPTTSELIEVFNYKTNMLKNKVDNLVHRLDRSSDENTNLSHEVSLYNSELEKYHSLNYEMHLKHERLQNETKDIKNQNSILRDGMEKLGKKFKADRLQFQNNTKVLEVKMAEIVDLQKQLTKCREKDEQNCEEIEKLKTISAKYNKRNEQLRQSLLLTEKEINEISSKLKIKEKESIVFSKKTDELTESLTKSENIIKHLETQMAEKNETIRSLENEMNETEEMRKTILSLMESKKPKRKI